MAFQLSEIAHLIQGKLHGKDARFPSISTDTRTLQAGQLFIALRGPNFDGHLYLDQAMQSGAIAGVVDHLVDHALPQIIVKDTRLALGDIARTWRNHVPSRFIGITGSNGKTTLKNMIANILKQQHTVLATPGNLNNDIGVPLTIAQVQDQDFAVIEMGANHPGEISYLTHMTQPEIAVLNNAGRAHLDGFDSLEGVAHAKAEIIQGIPQNGCFIYNADDHFAPLWSELAAERKTLTFGINQPADISSPKDSSHIDWQPTGFAAVFQVKTPSRAFEVQLPLAGEHNRLNALAAIAVAEVLQIHVSAIQQGLSTLQPVSGRLCLLHTNKGARIIDDSYNANPDSVQAALQVLKTAPGRRTLVLGDLSELGKESAALHAEVGQQANDTGIERVLSCGSLSQETSRHFTGESHHFATQTELVNFIQSDLMPNDVLLIKGSHASHMDQVVHALVEPTGESKHVN